MDPQKERNVHLCRACKQCRASRTRAALRLVETGQARVVSVIRRTKEKSGWVLTPLWWLLPQPGAAVMVCCCFGATQLWDLAPRPIPLGPGYQLPSVHEGWRPGAEVSLPTFLITALSALLSLINPFHWRQCYVLFSSTLKLYSEQTWCDSIWNDLHAGQGIFAGQLLVEELSQRRSQMIRLPGKL